MNVQSNFLVRPILLKKNGFLAQMLRALLRNRNGIFHLEQVNSSKTTKVCANLLNNRNIYICGAWYNTVTKLCRALFKYAST